MAAFALVGGRRRGGVVVGCVKWWRAHVVHGCDFGEITEQ